MDKRPQGLPEFNEVLNEDPLLKKYVTGDKVTVHFVRNCGIIVEPDDEGDKVSELSQAGFPHSANSVGFQKGRKKESISHPAHKIPLEIRRNDPTSKKGWRKYGGLIFGTSSSLFFSLTVLLAKILRDDYAFHPISITIWRYLGILLPGIPIAAFYHFCTQDEIFETVWPLKDKRNLKHACGYIIQGIFGCSSVIFRFYSLQYLTVADSSVIAFSSPVFITILAHFCLKEKCGIVSILVAILTAFGVFIIARPPMFTGNAAFDSQLSTGVALGVISMICASGLIILLRNIRQSHFSLLLLVGGVWGVLQSSVLGWTLGVIKIPGNSKEAIYITLLCLFTFFGQISIIVALKYEHAGPVSVIRSSEVLFSFFWQLQFLGIYPDVYSLAGAGVIVCAVIITALRKWVSGLPQDNTNRRRLSVFMK